MNTVVAFAMLCSAAIAGSDCDRANALDVLEQPSASVEACKLLGQVMAAEAFGDARAGRYVKVGCSRQKR
ncbi:hypothetical protein ABID82_007180 [Methylobacterium sp. PvP062]|uniref:Ribosomal protein S27 n=1 Tax=Methylobacterium radiotolerans TaxID=31998 RepID=A0ABV2NPM0_9HYPH|nr:MULTISPECIES: hypothetical protein [unclassified Methylobacterium]MBP2494959.1 hypothetical protein [Methylobacterium sp. PvP105]MBP2505170.1 hypothetical protein [Methylobacterium sp. PvP109]MCX7336522.1 hypothetical protein [Hyphomicrobiales bacterium]